MALSKDKIFKAADKHIRGNKFDKAINEYETWLKKNPKDWNTVRVVGDLYHRIGRNDEAIKSYSLVADAYKRDGFNVRSIATHKMILRLDSQNETAMRNLAELQAEEGLLMEAKSHYQTLVELYNKQGHKRRAAEVFKKLADIDPQDVKIRYKYAEFLSKQGKSEEASREYVGIADQFIDQGLVDEAVKILEQGRSLDTADPALKIKLAHAHTLQGNHAQAVRLLEEVRQSHPVDPTVLGRLGEAYLAAGNTADAETAFQQLNEAEPGNPDNVMRLADLRIAQSKFDAALDQLTPLVDQQVADNEGDKAAELLRKVLSKEPYHVRTLLKLAEVHTILKQDSARLTAYDSLCEAYNRSGDVEKAVQVAEQLVDLEPENAQHKDRLNFLKSKLPGPKRAATAPPSAVAAPPPEVPMDQDLRSLDELSGVEVDLGAAVADSFEAELTLDVDEPASSTAPVAADLGDIIELTDEDEENIKEKLTEAEVFVRYGLVDKAITQLLDVLESFRFHAESREKLIEIYQDQGMSSEASEQLMQMSRVYEKLGRGDESVKAREEAIQLNPALAAQAASAELAAQEELELTLSPETDSDLGDAGIDLGAPGVAEPPVEEEIDIIVDDAPEIEISLEESAVGVSADIEEEIPVEVDLGAADVDIASSNIDLGVVAELEVPIVENVPEAEEIPISVDENLPLETMSVEPDKTGKPDEPGLDLGDVDDPEIEIDLDLSDDAAPRDVAVEEGAAPVETTGFGEALGEELDISVETDAVDDEFSVEMPAASAVPLAAELEEVDEYIALGLYEDAQDTLGELLKQHPGNEDVLAKIGVLGFSVEQVQKGRAESAKAPTFVVSVAPEPVQYESPTQAEFVPSAPAVDDIEGELDPLAAALSGAPLTDEEIGIEALVDAPSPAPARAASSGAKFIDLAAELSDEIFGTQSVIDEKEDEPEGPLTDPGLDQIFKEFRKGVEKQLGTEDYDTRYNLGIAYKEMGLLDEAIAEFQLAKKDVLRGLECCSMLGLCFMEKGMPDIAIKWFAKGLALPGRREEEYHGLRYDLAQAHEAANQSERALELYQEIFNENARFRDVKDRVSALQATRK